MGTLSNEFLELQAALAGEYSIVRELGRGGMGIVYLARDVQLDRDVAIKVLPTHLAQRGDFRERFLREARTAAGLSHPHIVPIHRVGESGGFVFFVMSYIAGRTLGERLRAQGPLPPAETMRILREVAWALAYAHGRGIVHRDVKPDNILLEEGMGRALVTDFGIAHIGTTDVVTDPGKIMGTAHFMSPEQAASQAVDGRSDLYALGVVGYLAVSGRLPFEASTVPALLLKQATEPAPSLAAMAPGAPRSLAAAIQRCLRTDPTERFDNGEALATALAPAVDARPGLPAPLRGWLRSRNPAQGVYAGWSAILSIQLLFDIIGAVLEPANFREGRFLFTAALAAAPLLPIVGFHVSQARRLFRDGFTIGDLRAALDVDRRESEEDEPYTLADRISRSQLLLRWATYASILGTIVVTIAFSSVTTHGWAMNFYRGSWMLSFILLMLSNIDRVPLLPEVVRRTYRVGLRERLWRSALGGWLAKRLGAPGTSRPVGAGVFRATEIALGLAAAELYAALPRTQREQLAALPATVAALEVRAAVARTEAEAIDAMAPHSGAAGERLASRRAAAKSQLAASVAALEGIRLDLLRLHAGASDLAPLTTLLDAAKLLGDDVDRLARAERSVEVKASSAAPTPPRTPTPA